MTDDGAGEYDDDEDGGGLDASMDDGDASMLAAEQAMLDEMSDDEQNGNGTQASGAYVDVNLLEWEGMPADSPHHRTSLGSDAANSTGGPIRVRPVPENPHQLRLASTKAPGVRTPILKAAQPTTQQQLNTLPPTFVGSPLFTTIGGTTSSFQTVNPAHTPTQLPAVPIFAPQQ